MNLLEPRWNQPKPTLQEAQEMCRQVAVTPIGGRADGIENVLQHLRKSHSNGGALFGQFSVGDSEVFDWFASRNRFAEFSILRCLLGRDEVQRRIPELRTSSSETVLAPDSCAVPWVADGFTLESSFLLDGRIAHALYAGGAYGQSELDAKTAKQLALSFCDQLFEQRYSEVAVFSNFTAWTLWFHGIAWDWTAFIFDRRKRAFAVLALTDTD